MTTHTIDNFAAIANLTAAVIKPTEKDSSMEATLQRAQSAVAYIKEAGKADFIPDVNAAPILTNAYEYLRALGALSPTSEYYAARSIINSLGYTIINALAWKFRKNNIAEKPETCTIDIMNDGFADEDVADAKLINTGDLGFQQLPRISHENIPMLGGVYKTMLAHQDLNVQLATRSPMQKPIEILRALQQPEARAETRAAYDALFDKQIESSPAAAAIRARVAARKEKLSEMQVKQNESEAEFVMTELRGFKRQQFTNEVWAMLPLHTQFKLVSFVYRQTIETIIRAEDDSRKQDVKSDGNIVLLLELANDMQMELEAARRNTSVKFAFESGAINASYEVVTK
jgi:hypothetical protein